MKYCPIVEYFWSRKALTPEQPWDLFSPATAPLSGADPVPSRCGPRAVSARTVDAYDGAYDYAYDDPHDDAYDGAYNDAYDDAYDDAKDDKYDDA